MTGVGSGVGAGVGADAGVELVVTELAEGMDELMGAGVGASVVLDAGADTDETTDVDDSSAGFCVVTAGVGAAGKPEQTDFTTKSLSLHLVPVGTGFNIGTPWAHWYHQSPQSESHMMPLAGTLLQTDGNPEPLLVMSLQFPKASPSALSQRPVYSSAGPTPNRLPVESSGHAA